MLSVSNYHYIRPDFQAPFPSIFGMTPVAFKNQLLLLKNKGEFVSAKQLLSDTESILDAKDNFFFITFDDGLKEQYRHALPILDELGIPVILFANSRNYLEKKVSTVHKIHLLRSITSPSDFIKSISNFYPIAFSEADKQTAKSVYVYDDLESATLKYILNFKMDFTIQEEIIANIFNAYFDENEVLEKLYMNEEEIIDLGKRGFLGSHTHNHYPVGLLESDAIAFELAHSKSYFENLSKSKIEMVAYPYGTPEACTATVAKIAQVSGYKLGFTTTRGVNDLKNNYLLLNRFDCNDLPGGKNYNSL